MARSRALASYVLGRFLTGAAPISPVQKRRDPPLKSCDPRRHGLTFPNGQHAPACAAQRAAIAFVARGIACELRDPILAPRGGNATPPAIVHVPETAGDFDDLAASGKHEIRLARGKSSCAGPIAKPEPVQ